jgi:sporulation protein YlmC with PRC-barrel domain
MQPILVIAFALYSLVAAADPASEGLRARELLDTAVESPNGRTLGEVADLVVDLDRGLVRAVVVETGGKLKPHPAAALSRPPETGKLVLDPSRAAASSAAAFERDRWPDFGDPYWDAVAPRSARLARASDLIDGAIADIVFDSQSGGALALLHVNHSGRERRVPLAELK